MVLKTCRFVSQVVARGIIADMDLQMCLKEEFGSSVDVTAAGGDDAVDGVRPQVVAAPLDEAAAQQLVRWCGKHKIALVPRGGGSKIGWGAPPSRCDMILSSRHLNNVLDHDAGNATVSAQSGIPLADLDAQMRQQGQFLPLDFALHPGATLGGVIATNHSSATRLRYQTPRDLVVGMNVLLSDGRLIKNTSKVVKNVSGYDFGKLFIGSYGTLGFITSIIVRLRPEDEQSSWWQQAYRSWDEAAEMATQIITGNFEPAMLRISAAKSTFTLTARFDGLASSVQQQLQQLPPSEHEALAADHAYAQANLAILAHLPIARALDFAQKTEAAGADHVLWDVALGVVSAYWENPVSIQPLVKELCADAISHGGVMIVQKAPANQKDAALVWGETRSDFALHQQLKQRFDAAGIFSPGRFWGGL